MGRTVFPATRLAVVCALVCGALVACGGGAGGSGTGDDPFANGAYGGSQFLAETVSQQVVVMADRRGSLLWDKLAYTATPGDISFVVQNPSPVVHQFGVEGNGIKYESGRLSPGSTTTFTVKGLPAGDYQLVCNYANHKEAGMVAALGVR